MFNIKKEKEWINQVTLVTQLGLTMAGSILLGLVIGYYLDKWLLHTKGPFTIVFILLGIVGGGYTVYRQIMEATDQETKNKKYHSS
jgi:ATP synthase protein I